MVTQAIPTSFFSTCRVTATTTKIKAARNSSRRPEQYFPKTSLWGAMGIKFFDLRHNDGRMDLFIADMHSDMSQEARGPGKRKGEVHDHMGP